MEKPAVGGAGAITRYHYLLVAMLCVATFFEGYDFFLISLILDVLGKEFGAGAVRVFYVMAAVNAGAILGFFVIRLGDRFGRKPILIIAVLGYSLLSLLTAASNSLAMYTALQFLAKMFLVTEFGMAIIMVSEEMPAAHRGKFIAILEVAGLLGGAAAMLSSKFILASALGWRGMYVVGGAPLLIVVFLIRGLRETEHFVKIKSDGAARSKPLLAIWQTDSRKWLVLVGLMWFACYLCYAGVVYAWPYFAATERGWDKGWIGLIMTVATGLGMMGYLVSGWLLDALGRRATSILFFILGSASLVWAYNSRGGMVIPSVAAAAFFIFAFIPIASTLNAELFPTERRADATAWCNFLLGRPAQVATPLAVAFFYETFNSIAPIVSCLAVGPLVAALLVWRMFPETKGINLDDVK